MSETRSGRCQGAGRQGVGRLAGILFIAGLVALQGVSRVGGQKPESGKEGGEAAQVSSPLESGLIENVEVSLTFLDVEVLDRDGRPMPGLTKDDFKVRVGARQWPIYSLDDFCRCAAGRQLAGSRTDLAGGGPDGTLLDAVEPGDAVAPAADAVTDPTHPRFILFFDFSQIQNRIRGQVRAVARHWVSEQMQAGDEAMVVGYAYDTGVQEVTAFTRDRRVLLDAIDQIFGAHALVDPYPEAFALRMRACDDCMKTCGRDCNTPGYSAQGIALCASLCSRSCCFEYAMTEARRGRKSLEYLNHFMAGLESFPGRKALLLFTQRSTLSPATVYPLDADSRTQVGDHLQTARQTAASAVASRVSLNVVAVSASAVFVSGAARELGANLAEATGGDYNRSGEGVEEMLARAGRACCMYRIALRSPENPSRQVRPVRIAVRGRTLRTRYQVRFMTPVEKWVRRAGGYLAHPDRAGDLPIRVALIPVPRGEGRWGLSVQVAFDAGDLMFVSDGERSLGMWRVGALLTSKRDGKSWQMLTDSHLTVRDQASPLPAVLHARPVAKIQPGEYRLAAVIEDRNSNRLGATETSLVVAGGRSGETIMGPILLRERPRVVQLTLPLLGEKRRSPWQVSGTGVGLLPVDTRAVQQGDRLYAATWACAGAGEHVRPVRGRAGRERRYLHYVAREDVPAFLLPPVAPVPSGDCTRIEDVIDTTGLDPGTYVYHLRPAGSPATGESDGLEGEILDLHVTFTVVPAVTEPPSVSSFNSS
ncbi:MAG: hypothetical protein ACE5IK_06980 [Acidobacteriota bacterium]